MAVDSDPDAYDELSVVVSHGGTLVGIGSHGATFQAWRLESDTWQGAGAFGTTRASATDGRRTAVLANDLATSGEALLAMVTVGGAYHLFGSTDGGHTWTPASPPMPMPAGPQRGAAIVGGAGSPGQLLLAVDDGTGGRVFLAAP
jgi:hypothetical protein